MLNYHALSVTLLPYSSKEIIFTLNIEEIYRPNVQVQVIFGSSPTVSGWANENLYVINAGLKESITFHPLEIIGEDYVRVRGINVFLPEISPLDKATFGVDTRYISRSSEMCKVSWTESRELRLDPLIREIS